MKKIIIILALLALVIFLAFAKKGNKITIAGSTTVLPIAQATAEVYMDQNPDINISVRGGGTDFKPGFEYIEKEAVMPSCVIYFTDGWCDSFPEAPDYPTLWISTDKANFTPPFGEVINLEQRD